MKKFVLLSILFLSVTSLWNAKAQLTKIGGGIVLATGGRYLFNDFEYFNKSFGFNIRSEFDINKKLKVVPDFQIFLPNKFEYPNGGESKTTLLALNINANYILNPKKDFNFYLLGGLHLGGWNIKDSHEEAGGEIVDFNEFKFDYGVNAGGGFKFNINYRLIFFAEVKYTIAKTGQMVFSPGLIYDI